MKLPILVLIILFSINPGRSMSQIFGCTDPLASNFNSVATDNDGTCQYPSASISPSSSFNLSPDLAETSGLITWNNQVWSQNDNGDIQLYALDSLNGNIVQTYALNGLVNNDWEEISQDDTYLYIGDFGNNVNGNRTDLKILRVEKTSLLNHAPVIDTISFSYSDQTNFTPTGANNTDYDCEAFIVSADSIYLFTKQWLSNQTRVYSLAKIPGNHSAEFKGELNVVGMITGATWLENRKLIVLCGYTNLLQPFVYLLYDFSGNDFFNGNKRKISASLPFHQVEGIASTDGLKYYMTNEYFSSPPITTVPQKFHTLDLSAFLNSYLTRLILKTSESENSMGLAIYPNPAQDFITIAGNQKSNSDKFIITNFSGQIVLQGELLPESSVIDIDGLSDGLYWICLGEARQQFIKKSTK